MILKTVSNAKTNIEGMSFSGVYRFETLDEAKIRLGEKYVIYEDTLNRSKWLVLYIKDNTLVNESIEKELYVNGELRVKE